MLVEKEQKIEIQRPTGAVRIRQRFNWYMWFCGFVGMFKFFYLQKSNLKLFIIL